MNNMDISSLSIWLHPQLAGVKRGSDKSVHAKPVVKFEAYKDVQNDIIRAREDVDLLADRVLEKVWGDKNK